MPPGRGDARFGIDIGEDLGDSAKDQAENCFGFYEQDAIGWHGLPAS
jgi:hypothetical protein